MADNLNMPTSSSPVDEISSNLIYIDSDRERRILFSAEEDIGILGETSESDKDLAIQSVPDVSNSYRRAAEMSDRLSPLESSPFKSKKSEESGWVDRFNHTATEHGLSPKAVIGSSSDNKENIALPFATNTSDNTEEEQTPGQSSLLDSNVTASKPHSNTEDSDAEVVRRAEEEGRVNVVFPGTVTQEGCCRFVSEILKCILYQRQQLPMTYDQLVYSQKKQQASMQENSALNRRPVQSADLDWRKCEQTLQELEEVFQQLEVLFSLSRVPRVLLLIGGSVILPKELYEINMEALAVAGGDQCLRVSTCLRQLFRTLFVADILSDTRPVRLMPTTVLALAHRDCGAEWFRPKLQFKVPTRVKNQVIALCTDPSSCQEPVAEVSDCKDYVWFQAPMSIKGFGK